ncbi:hypothetical protein BDF14DRAFT_1019625 [Spinellus fusiger]|nr:hypothetical protein BDF14DRAFT_1019625 [Spinellus fusiger]
MLMFRSKNTMQLYSSIIKDGKTIVASQEYLLPSPVINSISIKEDSILYCAKDRQLYCISFIPKDQDKQKSTDNSLSVEITCLDSFKNIIQVCSIENEKGVFLKLLQGDGVLVTAQVNLSPTSSVFDNSPSALKAHIQATLKELARCEQLAKKIEIEQQLIDERLKRKNTLLYSLKTSRQLKGTPKEFRCEIKPILIEKPVREMTFVNMMLRVTIKVHQHMDWSNWKLHIDLNHQRTLYQEIISLKGEIKESIYGSTISRSLHGLTGLNEWYCDIPLEAKHSKLPLEVYSSLSLSQSIEEIDTDYENPIVFPISQVSIDELHFAVPCSSVMLSSIKSFGIQSVTERLQDAYTREILEDRSGRFIYSKLNKLCFSTKNPTKSLDKKLKCQSIWNSSNIYFKVFIKDGDDPDHIYRKILSSLLQEGRTENAIRCLLESAEKAYFTLALHPNFPVELLLLKEAKSSQELIVLLTINCYSSYVLFKVKAALLARLHNHLVEPNLAVAESQDTQDSITYLAKLHRDLVSSYQKLEEAYQESNEHEEGVWEYLADTMNIIHKIHAARPIEGVSFRIT